MWSIKTVRLLAILVMWTSMTANAQDVRYFSKLAGVISPFLEYNPRGEMTKEQAMNAVHYRVYYDDQNRFSRMDYYFGQHKSNQAYFYAHSVKYAYEGNKVIRTYYDQNLKPANLWRHIYMDSDIHKEVYETYGSKRILTLYNVEGEQVETGLGSYHYEGIQLDDKRILQSQYKKDGSTNILTNYFPTQHNVITTDENGYLEYVINVDPATLIEKEHPDTGYSRVLFDFDEFGNEVSWEFLDLNQQLVDRRPHMEDPGYARWLNDFTWVNRQLGIVNTMTKKLIKKDKKLHLMPAGVAMVKYSYNGNLYAVSAEYLNEQGKLIENESEIARVEIDRDKIGQRREIRFFDINGQLKQQGTAIKRFIYDQKNDLLKTANYDANEKEIVEAAE